jgi:hypothetical protein
MNTTEIITKLRAQAAELTLLADALEMTSQPTIALQGVWCEWADLPAGALTECSDGDYAYKGTGYGEWVGTAMRSAHPRWWPSAFSGGPFSVSAVHGTYRLIATGLTGHETADDIRLIVERFKASQVSP